MSHYHEVYFNDHTNDGPRVGMTRRTKAEIERERGDTWWRIGSAIVRCDRPDHQCPWTVEGVPCSHEDQYVNDRSQVVCRRCGEELGR